MSACYKYHDVMVMSVVVVVVAMRQFGGGCKWLLHILRCGGYVCGCGREAIFYWFL